MSNDNHQTVSLEAVIAILGLLFIVHIIAGMLLFGVLLAVFSLWRIAGRFRPLLFAGFVLMVGCLVFYLWPAPGESLPDGQMVYLSLLDALTGQLKIMLGVRGVLAFRLAKFILKASPLSLVVTGGLFFFSHWRRRGDKKQSDASIFKKQHGGRHITKIRDAGDGAYIGYDTAGKAIYLSDKTRAMHTQVIGSTGFGKTSAVLAPLLRSDLAKGKPVIFIDGKGDQKSLSDFLSLVKATGREYDTYIFAPTFANISNSWNPLATGNALVRKDRVIGAQIWTEAYYKKKSEDLMLSIFTVFDDLKITPTFGLLAQFLADPEANFLSGKKFTSSYAENHYQTVKTALKTDAKSFSGIIADINLMAVDFLGPMLTTGKDKKKDIDLYEVIRDNKVVYFNFSVLMMEETMRRLARMVIHDLKTVCSEIQSYVSAQNRKPVSVFIDEFGSFASESFIELLNKARSSGMAITMLHQSMGDIEGVSKTFARQIFENTNVKIVLRIDDPTTIEQYCRMAGTHQTMKYTFATDLGILGRSNSGAASMREVDVFNIDPNIFRRLKVGEAVVMLKDARDGKRAGVHYTVKLDHIQIPELDLSAYAEEARDIIIKRQREPVIVPVAEPETIKPAQTETPIQKPTEEKPKPAEAKVISAEALLVSRTKKTPEPLKKRVREFPKRLYGYETA